MPYSTQAPVTGHRSSRAHRSRSQRRSSPAAMWWGTAALIIGLGLCGRWLWSELDAPAPERSAGRSEQAPKPVPIGAPIDVRATAAAAAAATAAAAVAAPNAADGADAAAPHAPEGAPVQRSLHNYDIPSGAMMHRADGRQLPLAQALFDGRPVVLTFMYTTCTTVCPLVNHTLVAFENQLGPDRSRVNVVSISVDPDQDSVEALAEYAKRTGAKGSFFTGDPIASESVQRVFEVWRDDKAQHPPVVLMSNGAGLPWVRLDGLITPQQLWTEWQRMRRASAPS